MKNPIHPNTGFTERQLQNWLKKQPANREFYYFNNDDCLVASFLKEYFNIEEVNVGGRNYGLEANTIPLYPIPDKIKLALFEVNKSVFTISGFRKALKKVNKQTI